MTESHTPPPQPHPNPPRRRQGRNHARNPAQKQYMSENDMSSVARVARVAPAPHGLTPHTPEKTTYALPATNSTTRPASAKQQRIKNNRSHKKNPGAFTSPEPDYPVPYPVPQTTPQRAASASMRGASSVPAFAGATFHASPAPSALPKPSFFSKPTSSPLASKASAVQQQPSPPTDTEVLSPYRPPHPSSAASVTGSPLDFMFRAHREERERHQQGASNAASHSTPPAYSHPPFGPNSFPKAQSVPHSRPVFERTGSNGIDSDELGGSFGRPMGPAFSTPFNERIRAARPSSSRHPQPQNYQQQQTQDPSEALKKFLFHGNSQPHSHSTPHTAHHPMHNAASPFLPGHSNQGTYPSPTHVQNGYGTNQIQTMENDLKRILNLNNTADSTNAETGTFSRG